MTEKTETPLTFAETQALVWLKKFHEETGAEWSTEAQWRTFADRPTIKPESDRARGFRIPPMLEKGVIEMTTANFLIPRNGVTMDPVPLYRPV